MLTVAFVFACCSAFLDVSIGKRIPGYVALMEHPTLGKYFDLAGSLCIAWGMGALFGADGVTVLMATVMSTMMTMLYYHIRREMAKKGMNPDNMKGEFSEQYEKVVQTTKDVVAAIRFMIKILTAPFRMVRWCKTQWFKGHEMIMGTTS